jgi:hypothetical protein
VVPPEPAAAPSSLFARDSAQQLATPAGPRATALSVQFSVDEQGGMTVILSDSTTGITQSFLMTGDKLVVRVQGAQGESLWVQTPSSIAVSCEQFTVESRSIRIMAQEDLRILAQGTLLAQAKTSLEIQSAGTLRQQAAGAISLAGESIDAGAIDRITLVGAGTGVGILGGGSVEVYGTGVHLTGVETAVTGLTAGVTGSVLEVGPPPPAAPADNGSAAAAPAPGPAPAPATAPGSPATADSGPSAAAGAEPGLFSGLTPGDVTGLAARLGQLGAQAPAASSGVTSLPAPGPPTMQELLAAPYVSGAVPAGPPEPPGPASPPAPEEDGDG